MFTCYIAMFILFVTWFYAMLHVATYAMFSCCLCCCLLLCCMLAYFIHMICSIPSIHALTSLWSVLVGTKGVCFVLELAFAIFCFYKRLRYVFGLNIAFCWILDLFWIYFPVWDILITCRWDVYLFSLFRKFFRSSHAKEVLPKFAVNFGR